MSVEAVIGAHRAAAVPDGRDGPAARAAAAAARRHELRHARSPARRAGAGRDRRRATARPDRRGDASRPRAEQPAGRHAVRRRDHRRAPSATALDPALLAGLIKQESGFNPNAGSPAGAQGLTQLMPGTAAGLGVTNVLDPAQSIEGGAKYLAQQLDAFGGDVATRARRLQRRPRRRPALRRRAAVRRDPELRPRRAGQRRRLPRPRTPRPQPSTIR